MENPESTKMKKSAIQACLFDTITFQDNRHYTASWVRYFAFHYRFPRRARLQPLI